MRNRGILHALERRVFLALRARADRLAARRAGAAPKPAHLLTGERGEDLAFFHAARLRGDLDLVAWDGDTMVVFEVKTRTARDLAPAESAVDATKQAMLRRMALAYRRRFPEPWRNLVPIRFDILSVYDLPSGPEFEHLQSAFPLTMGV